MSDKNIPSPLEKVLPTTEEAIAAIKFSLVEKYGHLDSDFGRDIEEALREVARLTKFTS